MNKIYSIFKSLITVNKRDCVGLVGWFVISLFIHLWSLPIMVVREIYQWKHWHLSRLEWEDIVRYSIVITLGSIIHFLC